MADSLRIAYTTAMNGPQDELVLVKHAQLITETRDVMGAGFGVSQSMAEATGPTMSASRHRVAPAPQDPKLTDGSPISPISVRSVSHR